jgi:predicted RNA binding protein YcfA (HicA-like mRNA interferase family)
MSKREKLIKKMQQNPRDWRIEDLKTLADTFNIDYRQPGTSHVTFRNAEGAKITVPAHIPVKPIYVKKFLALLLEGKGD